MGIGGGEGGKVVDNKYEPQRDRGRGSVMFYGLAGGGQKNNAADLIRIALGIVIM